MTRHALIPPAFSPTCPSSVLRMPQDSETATFATATFETEPRKNSGGSRAVSRAMLLLLLPVLFMVPAANAADSGPNVQSDRDAYVRQRDRLARIRRFSFNNDGCDVLYFPTNRAVTPENLLDARTTNLPKTGVTTLTYCSISAGFGLFTHHTSKGEFFSWSFDKTDTKKKNIAAELVAGGKDVLRIMVDFCHANSLECFWSMRMNDTHDAATRPGKYYPLFPTLKKRHPEWLVGSVTEKTKFGPWSSVDYAVPEIRALAVSYVEEVCRNYDIDGIELDFCRHLCYFKSVARGGTASPEEILAMNGLMKNMRDVTDREGMRRGRPILLTVRVPDDAGYARALGLDLEFWMKNHLADIFIGSDYFHLNQWQYWSALGKRYDVPVYACLSESRVTKQDKRFSRDGEASYAARSAAAWDAGVDGIHIFNVYTATAPFLYSCASPEKLEGVEKVFFLTTQYGGYRPSSYLKDGESFRRLPVLTPDAPWKFEPDKTRSLEIDLGREPERNAKSVLVCCRFESEMESIPLTVTINGTQLTGGVVNKSHPQWFDFAVEPGRLRAGINVVEFKASRAATLADFAVVFSYRDK